MRLVESSVQAYASANPRSEARYDRAHEVLPGGITRSTLFFRPFPLTIERGDGAYLWDIDGHRYVNLVGEYSAGVYGHDREFTRRVFAEITERGLMLSGPVEFEEKLARLICARFPSCELVRFCNSGTEANLLALGLARTATGRDGVLVFDKAYHGGMLTYANPRSRLNVPFETVFSTYNDIDRTRSIIDDHADRLAAIIVEPMLGSGGCIPARPEFLRMLRETSKRHGIILVLDEVLTSRLAPGGLQSVFGITPDLTTLGKYIGGGFSAGLVGGRSDIMGLFDQDNPSYTPHFGTFNNNIASMAAGYIGLKDYYTPERAIDLNARGDALRETLNGMLASRELPMRFTGMGAVMNAHFSAHPLTHPPMAEDPVIALLRQAMHLDLLQRGIYTSARGLVTLNLMLEDGHIDSFIDAFSQFIADHADLIQEAIGAGAGTADAH